MLFPSFLSFLFILGSFSKIPSGDVAAAFFWESLDRRRLKRGKKDHPSKER